MIVGLTISDNVAGNGNVLLPLQPDLQDCVIVREVELLTGASCEHSADVWLASQPLALSTLAALTSKNQQCSIQQVMPDIIPDIHCTAAEQANAWQ